MSRQRFLLASTLTIFGVLQVAPYVSLAGVLPERQPLGMLCAFALLGFMAIYQTVLRLAKADGVVLVDMLTAILAVGTAFTAYSSVTGPHWIHVPLGLQLEHLVFSATLTWVYFVAPYEPLGSAK